MEGSLSVKVIHDQHREYLAWHRERLFKRGERVEEGRDRVVRHAGDEQPQPATNDLVIHGTILAQSGENSN